MKQSCELCGEWLAQTSDGYKLHYNRFHSTRLAVITDSAPKTIKPVRTTNRTKAQIVHDMEIVFGKSIWPIVRPWHTVVAC